jgi:chromosome segregation ATPase
MRFWPFKKDANADGRIALGNFNLGAQLPNQRTITVAGYIYSDDDAQALNARLDLYQEVIERQRLRCEIPELEAKREQMLKGIEQAKEVLEDLRDRQSKGETLTSVQKQQINNMSVTIKKMLEEVDKGTEAIKEARLKAGVG